MSGGKSGLTTRGASFLRVFRGDDEEHGEGGPHPPGVLKNAFAGYVLTVNFVLGAGMFPIPSAFHEAGMFMGAAFCPLTAFLAYLTMGWLVETQARMAYLTNTGRQKSLAQVQGIAKYGTIEGGGPGDAYDMETAGVVEVSALCQRFLGTFWRYVWDVAHFLYNWSGMWMYCSIFSSGVNEVIGIPGLTSSLHCVVSGDSDFVGDCLVGYRVWVAVFSALLILLLVRDWKFMSYVQAFVTVFAYASLFLMIITLLVAAWHHPYAPTATPVLTNKPYFYSWSWVNLSNFSFLFGTALFSDFCHMGCPVMLQQMGSARPYAKRVFAAAFVTTTILYVTLGLLGALYFGDSIDSVITLNWHPTKGESNNVSPPIPYNWLAMIVLLFPCATTGIAFLNYNKTIATHIYHHLPVSIQQRALAWGVGSVTMIALCRVSMALPPLLLALVTRRVKIVTDAIGLLVFWMMFFIPTGLQWFSYKEINEIAGHAVARTPYYDLLGSRPVVVIGGLVAAGFYIYFIVGLPSTFKS